ncbi:hypothetical protein N9609_00515 [bacterium]|nr:hypothetical protein [bacterium]
MTYKQKYSENKKLIKLYDDFLMAISISLEDRLKLITEIARLHIQNKKIEEMPVGDFHSDTNGYKFQIDSEECNTL